MKIVSLMEDTPGGNGCLFEHGFSLYVETKSHRILADTGASCRFLENAKRLGIDLAKVDTVILSHGHYDHSGGILAFAGKNPNARIYIRENAFEDFYHVKDHGRRYIGIDKEIKKLEQVVIAGSDLRIDEELFLFTNVTGRRMWPEGNRELKVVKNGEQLQDDFSHEQYLIIQSEGKEILISGCAHNGILNILERYWNLRGRMPDALISGFHMAKKSAYTMEEEELIRKTALELKAYPIQYYTGHCTGEAAYQLMQGILGSQIEYIRCGGRIEL